MDVRSSFWTNTFETSVRHLSRDIKEALGHADVRLRRRRQATNMNWESAYRWNLKP